MKVKSIIKKGRLAIRRRIRTARNLLRFLMEMDESAHSFLTPMHALFSVTSGLEALLERQAGTMVRLEQISGDYLKLQEGQVRLMASLAEMRRESLREFESFRPLLAGLAQADSGAAQEGPSESGHQDLELDLLRELMPWLPKGIAIDVGANKGAFAGVFLDMGMQVIALEPHPEAFQSLLKRYGASTGFDALQVAVVDIPGEVALYPLDPGHADLDKSLYSTVCPHVIPDGWRQESPLMVRGMRLDQILAQRSIAPTQIACLKVDVEGAEALVLESLGDHDPLPLVLCEFWQKGHCFSQDQAANLPNSLVDLMRSKGYRYSITIARDELDRLVVTGNTRDAPPSSWGNLLFTPDRDLFARALTYLRSVLRTDASSPTLH
jgi:FkbM family methyltransferase